MLKLLLRHPFASLLLILVLAASPWAWQGLVTEPDSLVIVHRDAEIPGWPASLDGYRIAILSDIHMGAPYITPDKMDRIIELTNGELPDLVVLLGDYVVTSGHHEGWRRMFDGIPNGVVGSTFVPPAIVADKLKGLKAPAGMVAILGNHDWWLEGENTMRKALEAAAIPVLENQALRIASQEVPAEGFWLGGLADAQTRTPDIAGTLAQVTDSSPVVMLSHSPDTFPDIPSSVKLTIAGHNHGGQVYLPWLGRPGIPSKFGERFGYGEVVENGHTMIVTSGIGTSFLPIRFNVPPEVLLLRILAPQQVARK